jgi:hypothetical protein
VTPAGPGRATATLSDLAASRCELLVIGRPDLPEVLLDGKAGVPLRRATGSLNAFAGYARDGMTSAAATPWQMAAYDLASGAGKPVEVTLRGQGMTAEAWVLADVPTGGEAAGDGETPLSFAGQWRETVPILAGAVAPPRRATAAEIASATAARIELDVFGNDAGRYGAKTLFLGGTKIGTLPQCGDGWQAARFDLDAAARAALQADNTAVIRSHDATDKFKVQRIRIVLVLPDGGELAGPATGAFVSDPDWAHAAGAKPFAADNDSGPIALAL